MLPTALVAVFVAIAATAYELRASLQPQACSECPHCQSAAAERRLREQELATWYARKNGLETEDDDERRIG